MVDNVMIWDTALRNSSITALNRNILDNCTSYSGNGQGVAYLETTHEILILQKITYGMFMHTGRSGDVFGEYQIQVTSFDENGSELSYNESSKQDYTTSWNSQTS